MQDGKTALLYLAENPNVDADALDVLLKHHACPNFTDPVASGASERGVGPRRQVCG